MHKYTFKCVKCGLEITKKSMAEFQAAIDKHTESHRQQGIYVHPGDIPF